MSIRSLGPQRVRELESRSTRDEDICRGTDVRHGTLARIVAGVLDA